MLKIYFNNFKNILLKWKISRLFHTAIKSEGKFSNLDKNTCFEVDLRYVSSEEIKKLNKAYRDVDKETDVLSFPMIDFSNGEEVAEKYNMLGDIVICKEIAELQARKFGHSVKREICFLALHGFLHLLGYDHIEKEDEKIMMSKADEILKKNGVDRK